MFKFLNNLFCFYSHMINNLFIYLTVQTSCSVNNSQGVDVNIMFPIMKYFILR